MTEPFPIFALAPLVLFAAAALFAALPKTRLGKRARLSEGAALLALALMALSLVPLLSMGTQSEALGLGLLLKFDTISATMGLLVGFVGWVVLRYSRSYLDGEARETRFHALMLATLGAVMLIVLSGNLPMLITGFIATGAGLRSLLLFYKDRPEARRAAAKFTLVWGAGDAALILAALLIWGAFGMADFAGLMAAVQSAESLPLAAQFAVALLVLTAALKTAAFPLHGWLTEVMEAPTPVSALLHAGIINSGGFLLIRMSEMVQASPGAMAALVMLGGITALFGAVVMLTQSAIKTALAWSTVSQMGFMLLQCGLGLWVLALLHIVAHSLYKAHAFLGSGNAVRAVAALRRPGPVAAPNLWAVARAFGIALVLYAGVAIGFSLLIGPKSAQALALGAILIFGVAYLVAQGLADAAPKELARRTTLASLAAAFAYFTFQLAANGLWGHALPATPNAGALEWALIVLALISFGLVAVAQALFPIWSHHPAAVGLRVHLANGLYLNTLLDRLIGGLRAPKAG
jgi:NAD(P)H-quinone oxidoreductase subunit 5